MNRYAIARMTLPILLDRLSLEVSRDAFRLGEALRLEATPHAAWWGACTCAIDYAWGGPVGLLWCKQTGPDTVTVYAADPGTPAQEVLADGSLRELPAADSAAFDALCKWLGTMAEENGLGVLKRARLEVVRGWPDAQAAGMTQADYCHREGIEPDTLRTWEKEFSGRGLFTGWGKRLNIK